ncbi:hypothetical protein GOP47_0017514 [Adiantum capillus-veneris]|uniref:WW domain-containing protein n=1 Tax=Adiantum capillus-veneris TaxID=13818 RepID=A0A9D4ZBU9_ADICA|nr:hypothetical protein GOP47_0017514 [Adiantum capillus-veneris]
MATSNSLCCPPSSSSSNLSMMQDASAASRWSKEVMGAVEAHLGLSQQHYHRKQCRQHRERSKESERTMCAYDWESDDCASVMLSGSSDDEAIAEEDNDPNANNNEQSGIGAVQLVDLINFQAATLPEGWEQHLDLRTGQVFYIHWKSCKKSNVDPRKMVHLVNERILELMHHTREEEAYIELPSGVNEELLEQSPSECITSQSASTSSHISDEVQSKYTPFPS